MPEKSERSMPNLLEAMNLGIRAGERAHPALRLTLVELAVRSVRLAGR
jgi:hypothetical protein